MHIIGVMGEGTGEGNSFQKTAGGNMFLFAFQSQAKYCHLLYLLGKLSSVHDVFDLAHNGNISSNS